MYGEHVSVAEDLSDEVGARRSGTMLDEDSNAVGVRRLDRRWEVDRVLGLVGDRGRTRLDGHLVCRVRAVGVVAHAGHRRNGAGMDVDPGLVEGSGNLGNVASEVVLDCSAAACPNDLNDPRARGGVAPNNDIGRGVDDGEMNAIFALDRCLYIGNRSEDVPHRPARR